jgi:FtsP/CotA-like multicopper oxidase with cupredoxin domain
MAHAGRTHLSIHANGRRTSQLFHHQWQGLSRDGYDPYGLDETLKVRFIGTNNGFIHPMHIHGGPFEVVARDGQTLPPSARFLADTVNVGPGERYDVIWTARRPGK